MATSTFLSNATISITQDATTTDLSDQGNACTVTVGFEPLTVTAFGDTGTRMTQGLQTVDVSIDFFLSYGATEVEAILASCLGKGTTTLPSRHQAQQSLRAIQNTSSVIVCWPHLPQSTQRWGRLRQ
jgi:hypothetical protein